MKLTKGVNFTIILCAPFSYKSVLCSFSLVTVWLCDFLAKEYQHKVAHKMLIKLNTYRKKKTSSAQTDVRFSHREAETQVRCVKFYLVVIILQ